MEEKKGTGGMKDGVWLYWDEQRDNQVTICPQCGFEIESGVASCFHCPQCFCKICG